MASMGKCSRCNKTVYQLEAVRYGPPGKELVSHKGCFKCENEGCAWQLTIGTYHYYEGHVYCKAHNAMTGSSNKVHAAGSVNTDAKQVALAINSPKLGVVNEQIHAGGANSQGLDSVHVKHALSAPKLEVEGGGQVKATGGKNAQGMESIHIQHALNAPKLDVEGSGQIRGAAQ